MTASWLLFHQQHHHLIKEEILIFNITLIAFNNDNVSVSDHVRL